VAAVRLAVLGDIHGNIRAFEAVLNDAKASKVDQVIFLGDLVVMGLDPQLSFDLLMEQKPLVMIKGNTDVYLENLKAFPVKSEHDAQILKLLKYTSIRMHQKAKEKLSSLPSVERLEIEGVSLICCHGTPYDDNQGITKDTPFSPKLSKKLAEEKVDLIFSAHTHIPADFQRDGIRFINPGAVGYSFDGDVRPSYALVDIEDTSIRCIHRRVDYDIHRYIMEVEHALEGFPLFDRLHYPLEHGKQLKV
jgi:putative phosphoesterase